MVEAAEISLLVIFSLVLIFHILVLVKVIPYSIVWGGRLKTDTEMYKFEFVSLLINSLFLMLVLIKADLLNVELHETVVALSFWVMAALFLLNSVGNLLSKSKWEKIIFTPLTILLTFLTIVVALN